MPKSVTYTAQAINDNLRISFFLDGSGTIDQRARCLVEVVADSDDPQTPALRAEILFRDLANLGTFAGSDWNNLKALLAKVRNQAIADLGL